MDWDLKVQLAKTLDIWDEYMAQAVLHLNDVTPEGYGYGSSDRNHVTMGMVEGDLADRLTR